LLPGRLLLLLLLPRLLLLLLLQPLVLLYQGTRKIAMDLVLGRSKVYGPVS
jgi:hypothetical protein